MTKATEAWMRGAGPVAVLRLLSERDMYGYEIAETLGERSDGVLAMGHSTLYPLLYKLEKKGLVARSKTRNAGGRPRKYYALTDAGHARLREQEREWHGLVEAMGRLGLR